jgi:Glycosyl hydrolases family 16
MPTGNIPGWNQVFSDDFTTNVPLGSFSGCTDGATIATSNCSGLPTSVRSQLWAYPDGWSDTSGNGTYMPSQVLSVHDSELDYNMHTTNGVHMVSAVVPKIPGGADSYGGLQYGAYVVRFKADVNPGYKTAFLLWPDSNVWPLDGEIDFPEGNLDGTMNAYMHQQGASSGSQQNAYSSTATYSSWHTLVTEWTAHSCQFILDGKVVGSSTSLIPNTPMHWVLQAETELDGIVPSNSVTDHLYIDWIAAYSQAS